MCPSCQVRSKSVIKKGKFLRTTGYRKSIQRFYCKRCQKYFSRSTQSLGFRQKKSYLNRRLTDLLMAGLSQRKCAYLLGIHRTTVARKMRLLGLYYRKKNQKPFKLKSKCVVFDEMETFEHSKCKPLSIALTVEEDSRKIVSVKVAQMPAKGRLARVALKRYGYRKDERREALAEMLREVKRKAPEITTIKSDQCPRYPSMVRRELPHLTHVTYKGRRACVVGQGELKAGGFDPLFSLNHTCAMFRDNLKRLSRRTWCSTKKKERLQDLLDIYVAFHNAKIDGAKRLTWF